MTSYFENGNDPLGFIEVREFLDQSKYYWLTKTNFAFWS
jgi:hypothetical protein